MYNSYSYRESSEVSSHRSPTLIEIQISDKHEEVHSSPPTEKNPSERHSIIQEEEDPLSYNIEKRFEAFTFSLYKKEVSRKRVHNEKQNNGTLKEIQEDEVLFERTDEYSIIVATTSATLSQATAHNVTVLNEKISQDESNNNKLKDEIISLKAEVKKRRKVECDTTLLQANILEQQEKHYDVKMECFAEIKKMADKVKMVEKHLEIVSWTYQRMRDLQAKIEDLEEWRSTKKNIPSILPMIKSYDISVHTLATTECRDLSSRFEENARKDLAGMMDLYEKSIYDIQRYI